MNTIATICHEFKKQHIVPMVNLFSTLSLLNPSTAKSSMDVNNVHVASEEKGSFLQHLTDANSEAERFGNNLFGSKGAESAPISFQERLEERFTGAESQTETEFLRQVLTILHEFTQKMEQAEPGIWQMSSLDSDRLHGLAKFAGIDEVGDSLLLKNNSAGEVPLVHFIEGLKNKVDQISGDFHVLVPETSLPLIQTILEKFGVPVGEIEKITESTVDDFGQFDLVQLGQNLGPVHVQEGKQPVSLGAWDREQLYLLFSQAGLSKEDQQKYFPEFSKGPENIVSAFSDTKSNISMTGTKEYSLSFSQFTDLIEKSVVHAKESVPKADVSAFMDGLGDVLTRCRLEVKENQWTPVISQTVEELFHNLQQIGKIDSLHGKNFAPKDLYAQENGKYLGAKNQNGSFDQALARLPEQAVKETGFAQPQSSKFVHQLTFSPEIVTPSTNKNHPFEIKNQQTFYEFLQQPKDAFLTAEKSDVDVSKWSHLQTSMRQSVAEIFIVDKKTIDGTPLDQFRGVTEPKGNTGQQVFTKVAHSELPMQQVAMGLPEEVVDRDANLSQPSLGRQIVETVGDLLKRISLSHGKSQKGFNVNATHHVAQQLSEETATVEIQKVSWQGTTGTPSLYTPRMGDESGEALSHSQNIFLLDPEKKGKGMSSSESILNATSGSSEETDDALVHLEYSAASRESRVIEKVKMRERVHVLDQITQGVYRGIKNNKHQLTLTLYPKELGEVKVDMHVKDNQVSLSFLMDSPKVKEILESHLQEFRNGMEQRGFVLTGCDVSVDQKEKNPGQNEWRFAEDQQQKHGSQRQRPTLVTNDGAVGAGRQSHHRGQINTIV